MSSNKAPAITLILMRHAEPVSGSALDDMSIPLSPVGKEREEKLCQEMKKQGFIPEIMIASPCLRAKQTAEVAAAVFHIGFSLNDALLEPFQRGPLLNLVKNNSHVKTIAFVGHGPSLTEFANSLLEEKPFQAILAKSSAAALQVELTPRLRASALLSYLQQN